MATLQGNALIKQALAPVAVTSDAATGSYVDYNGYNRALVICEGGLVGTGDSDDTVTFLVNRVDDIAAASAAASDHVAITAATTALGPVADTDVALGIEFIDIEFAKHSLDNGCLVVTATGSDGISAVCAATIVLYAPSGKHTDTDMTIVTPASS